MSRDVAVYSKYTDLVEKPNIDAEELARPDLETQEKITERTRAALEKKINGKIKATQPKALEKGANGEGVYVRYTPAHPNNPAVKQRIVRMHEMPVDPLDPPKFTHKKVPQGPPSPPVPIMHSPPRKLSVQELGNWKIPPCISNWKNSKGFTIPLDKRLAADGRGLQEVTVNDNFAKLAEALYVAERNAQAELEERSKLREQLAKKQKEQKEQELRNLAATAREKRTGMMRESDETQDETADDIDERDKRDSLRAERRREREREMRLERRDAHSKKPRTGADRDGDRDVSEAIALGKSLPKTADSQFDSRLFNQSQGVSMGFGADDDYSIYSKPFQPGGSSSAMYRPRKDADSDSYGGDAALDSLLTDTSKFKADKGFSGADSGQRGRNKPVAFERAAEADTFGMEQFFSQAKSSSSNSSSSRSSRRG
eukprot:TRINITY_DN2325_c0_g1_i12.p1 TRINITY_DN2325_c0_g1~~TRINITY_DN2325_c0_g1_i12.p1  ORF type:complete len:447 (-),score=114.86 TRINITY_DN2325_c0_g1_i12:91-1374(-)